MKTEQQTSKQTISKQEYVVQQQGQSTTEHQQQYSKTNGGQNEVSYRRQEVVVSQNNGQQVKGRNDYAERDLYQSQTVNLTPQRQNFQQQQVVENTTVSYNQQQNKSQIQSSTQQNQNFTNELSKTQQIKTFYSGNYEEECYLCQNGLHQAQDTQHQQTQQYQIQQNEENQQQLQLITSLNQQNQVNEIDGKQTITFYSDKYENQCYLCQHGLHGVQDTQNINIQQHQITEMNQQQQVTQINQQSQNIDVEGKQTMTFYSDKYENQCYLCQHGLHGVQETQNINIQQHQKKQIEVNQQSQMLHQQNQVNVVDGNQLLTFYSDKYENICYLCQHGLHGKEENTVIKGPEVIISQTIGQPISSKKERSSTTVQNFSQVLNTPIKEDIYASQQVQVSPIQNVQMNTQSSQINQIQQQIIVPQVQTAVQQQIPIVKQQQLENKQIVVNQQMPLNQSQQIIPQVYQQQQQITQIKPIQYTQQIIQTPPQGIIKTQEYQIAQYSPIQQQRFLQQSQQVVQMTAQEQVEQYWRLKVYELQERVYELMNEIKFQKQQNLQTHQRTSSQVKKNTEDTFKQQQLQNEIKDLEKQLSIKQRRAIDVRNNLNYLIYKKDPTEDATKYKEQELQQLRQRYNTLNFKYQSNQEDIAMTQAVLDAIKSGKGYKIVREQQTISQSKSYQNNQSLRQG